MKAQDLAGLRFGRLTVIRKSEFVKNTNRLWECLCDCGNVVYVRADGLRRGTTRSCGCLARELSSEAAKKSGAARRRHGQCVKNEEGKRQRIYSIWNRMKDRCNNPKSDRYSFYGGRGIKVCDEWNNDFAVFFEWAIASGYRDDLTIDRIETDGNYEPGNCRWVTVKEQANNRRSNHRLTHNGETHTIAEWAEITGLSYDTIKQRISKLHWSVEEALTVRPRRSSHEKPD